LKKCRKLEDEKEQQKNSANAFIIDQTGAISCMSSICDISRDGSKIFVGRC